MEPTCQNPRCGAAPIITDGAIARIVIEMRPGVGIESHWWRHDGTSAFAALRMFHAMLESARQAIPTAIRAGLEKLAGYN